MKVKLKTKKARPKAGGNFEKKIAKEFSLIWTEGKRSDIFYKTPGSGSRFTSRFKKSQAFTEYQSGDITFTDPIGKPLIDVFNIECKKGYGRQTKKRKLQEDGSKREIVTKVNWDILDFIDSKQDTPIFQDFWDQCCDDAFKSNREPLLIFQRNNKLACICMKEGEFNQICDFYGVLRESRDLPIIALYMYNEYIIIINFQMFIRRVSNDGLRAYCEEICRAKEKEKKAKTTRRKKTP